MRGNVMQPPEGVPPQLWESLVGELDDEIAPFLPYLNKNLTLTYEDPGEGRLGLTRFEFDLNELERRRRFKMGPGMIAIMLHPDLNDDIALRDHTLAHELVHASGITSHNAIHSQIVDKIAPAPRLKDSIVLQNMRQRVLESLPERTWICGNCGHAWERRRVTKPTRCPKCARPFKKAN
jgi:predicted Zn-ribbon and HTH transcriptional regulator